MDYNSYNQPPTYTGEPQALGRQVAAAMKLVFLKMALGLIVTGVVAWFCANSMGYMQFLATHSWMMWLFVIAELGLVFSISGAVAKMKASTASLLFYVFAIVNGLMLSTIFLAYSLPSLAKTFFITAGTFGAMAIYGYTTSKDLSKFGSILFMCLIGLIIASLVNIFTHSSTLDWIISIAGVLIFVGLTAWDVQAIKQMAMMMPANQIGLLATRGALSLYLDFINLFLYLLRFFGSSRD